MRAFPVRLPSGARYWTVLDEDLAVVPVADGFLRQVRFGRDGAESTTKSYAHSIALFLRWCSRTGRTWQAGAAQLPLFISWLQHAGPAVSGADADALGGAVLAGPGLAPARSARRVNGVLTAVRSMVVHAVAAGQAGGDLLPLCMRWPMTGTCPLPPGMLMAGWPGGCGPGTGCTSRSRRWAGLPMSRSSRCCGRAGRRGTG
jgi:integrase/recombinase XerD